MNEKGAWRKLWKAIEDLVGQEATVGLRAQYRAWTREDFIAADAVKRRRRLARNIQELTYTAPNTDRRRFLEKRIELDRAWFAKRVIQEIEREIEGDDAPME